MSLLTIVQNAMVLCKQERPTSVYSNTSDALVQQFMYLAQETGDELSRFADWRQLKVTSSWTGDGTTTNFDLPSDFDRFVTGHPIYEDEAPTTYLRMVTDDELIQMKVSATQPIKPVWRLIGEEIEFYPAPDSGAILKYEYRSAHWITDDTGASRLAEWTADTNLSVIPDRLISLGCRWRFNKTNGFDYAEDFRTYQIECAKAAAVNQGRTTLRARSEFIGDYADAPAADPRVIV